MTTILPHVSRRNKPQAKSRLAVGRIVLVMLAILLSGSGQAAAESIEAYAIDAGEQLYRRGYPKNVDLEWAVSDYNSVHHSNSVAKNYPELQIAEILPAISRAITETPRKEKQKLARLAALKKSVISGQLPRGSILTFQCDDKNRTPYWFQWEKLSDNFSIFLFSGLDENPPETERYNEKAFIIGVLIRTQKRTDQEWKDLLQRIAEKNKRKSDRQ